MDFMRLFGERDLLRARIGRNKNVPEKEVVLGRFGNWKINKTLSMPRLAIPLLYGNKRRIFL
jgi:hypothetical protein